MKSPIVLGAFGLVLAAAGACTLWVKFIEEPTGARVATSAHTVPAASQLEDLWQEQSPPKNYSRAQDPNTKAADVQRLSSTQRIDKEGVKKALGKLEVDERGDLVVDEGGLSALYQGLGYGGHQLTAAELSALLDVIRNNLPEPAASQTASIVESFSDFISMKKQADALHIVSADSQQLSLRLQDLDVIRDLAFGRDTAAKLFRQQRAHEQYMLEMFRLVENTALSEEERKQRRAQFSKQITFAPDIDNWDLRHAAFIEQKQAIVASHLSHEEKARQIEQLFKAQFSPGEAAQLKQLRLTEY